MGKRLEEYGIVRAEVGRYFLFCTKENLGFWSWSNARFKVAT
jgi:hypothetical protein